MLHNIQRLIYLCQVKNDLNRRRRRFYYYMHAGFPRYMPLDRFYEFQDRKPKHISVSKAKKGYKLAQKQMKAMTKEMRQMRIDMGVTICWGGSGNITAIKYQGHRLEQRGFYSYYEAEKFEMSLFKV